MQTAMRSLAYTNPTLAVPSGTTVVWSNQDHVPHTMTADDSSFDSGVMNSDAT